MTHNKILVPFDFTDAARKAALLAAAVAKIGNMQVTLLHVAHKTTDTGISRQLESEAEVLRSKYNVVCEHIIREGKVLSEINALAGEFDFSFMVIGSHGYKGFFEKIQGMDLLKLLKDIPFPALTVQESYQMPENGIKSILLPGSSHNEYKQLVDATAFIAGLFGSQVILYTVEKPGFTWSETLRLNLSFAIKEFKARGIQHERINESPSAYSVGYSKQILQYAGREKVDLIAVMSVPTEEYYYIADSEKERLLVNDLYIPVLCVSDKDRV